MRYAYNKGCLYANIQYYAKTDEVEQLDISDQCNLLAVASPFAIFTISITKQFFKIKTIQYTMEIIQLYF